MTIIEQLDKDYVISALRSGVPRSEIYQREYTRLQQAGVSEHWTEGVIANFARKYRNGEYNGQALKTFPTYVYGVDPEIEGGLPLFTGHEKLTGDWLVISDLHIPLLDMHWFNLAMHTAREENLKNVILLGDVLDALPASSWPDLVPRYTENMEISQMRSVGRHLSEEFEQVVVVPGNHDRRYIKRAGPFLTFEGLLAGFMRNLPDNVIVTEYDRVTITSGGVDWTLPHPAAYSRTGGNVAQKLINKYRTNVIVPHQHYSNFHPDENNFNIGLDIGGLMWIDAIAYSNLTTTTSRPMKNGYATIINGEGVLHADLQGGVKCVR